MKRQYGFWGMHCWNGLSAAQQTRLIEVGNLELGYQPEGECPNGAEVEITTVNDVAPGPRFYCRPCAIAYLEGLLDTVMIDGVRWNWCACGDTTHNPDGRCNACRDVDALLEDPPS